MSANFNDQAIAQILDKLVSYGLASGRFDAVNQHEPKNAPGSEITLAIWVQNINPVRSSGLAATSGVLIMNARIYQNFRSQPFDAIDPKVMGATTDLMGSLSGDFLLGGVASVRNVDLLGSSGKTLSAQAGYVEIDREVFRVMTITVPIIINDMFTQEA
jgi:hypothetical protein